MQAVKLMRRSIGGCGVGRKRQGVLDFYKKFFWVSVLFNKGVFLCERGVGCELAGYRKRGGGGKLLI